MRSLKDELLERPRIVEKPWGHEEWLSVTKRYVLKKLVLKRGARFSLQYHRKKEESLHILEGRVKMTLGRDPKGATLETHVLQPGDTLHIVPKTVHRAEALTRAVIVEASTTELLDVVRLSDDYAREGTHEP